MPRTASKMCQYGVTLCQPASAWRPLTGTTCSLERTPLSRMVLISLPFWPILDLASTLLCDEFTHDLLLVSAGPLSSLLVMPPHWLEGG